MEIHKNSINDGKNISNLKLFRIIRVPIRNSIVAIIPACHAGDPSSILGCGGFL